MSNPYQPPAATVANPSNGRSKQVRAGLFGVGLLFAVLAALIPSVVIPRYQELFIQFGLDLPFITQLVLRHYRWSWVLPLCVVAVRFAGPFPARRAQLACGAGVAAFALVLLIVFIAANLPMWTLGAVV
jgi:hypothetical protein